MLKFEKIRPLFDRVLIRKIKPPNNTPGGILLPHAKGIYDRLGVVVNIGDGKVTDKGNLIKSSLKVGQVVFLPEFGGQKVPKQNGNTDIYYIFNEGDIIAILEESEKENI